MKENLRKCLLEGKIIPFEKITIDELWRGFLYGDGVFETLRVKNYVIFRWGQHWERLVKNASLCNLLIKKKREEIEEDIIKLLKMYAILISMKYEDEDGIIEDIKIIFPSGEIKNVSEVKDEREFKKMLA